MSKTNNAPRKSVNDDPWEALRLKLYLSERKSNPLAKSLNDLGDTKLEIAFRSGKPLEQNEEYWSTVFANELIHEVEWLVKKPKGRWEDSEREDYDLLDDLRVCVGQARKSTGHQFRFVQWMLSMGQVIGRAWVRRDGEFFSRHAALWKALCEADGSITPRMRTNIEAVLDAALSLKDSLKRDPTKQEVRGEVRRRGIRIAEKDWPKYWRKCGLAFLPQAKGGRPAQRPKTSDSKKRQSDG